MTNDAINLITQLIKGAYQGFDDTDENSFQNTVLNFFESPEETVTFSVSAQTANTSTSGMVGWGGLVNGSMVQAGWYWSMGGLWQ